MVSALQNHILIGENIAQVKGLRKRKNGRWETQIMHKGVRHYLGTFDTAEEALDARNRRARELSITEATLPSRSPTAKRAKRAASASPSVPEPFQGAPAAVPMIAQHVALAYQQGMGPPVVYPGQIPVSKDMVQYQQQMMYHHHPSTAQGSLQQQHMQQVHMQQPHVPMPEGAAPPPNTQNVSTGVPCSMSQPPQEGQPHELTLRAMMSNPAHVLNMTSGGRSSGMPAGASSAPHGVPAPLDGGGIPPPMASTGNGMPPAMQGPSGPDASQGAMYSDAGMAPPAVPQVPEQVPGPQGSHDIPAPHHGAPMIMQVHPKLEAGVHDHSGLGVGATHDGVPAPEAAGHELPADVPAPGSPEEAPIPIVPPAIPPAEGAPDKPGSLPNGEYNSDDPTLHQQLHFPAVSSEIPHAQADFHSPAFAGMSSVDNNVVNTSGVERRASFGALC